MWRVWDWVAADWHRDGEVGDDTILTNHTDEKGTASKIWRGVTRMVKYKVHA